MEGVVLRKGKIGVHLRAPSLERAIPARWLPSVSGTGRDHREGAAAAAAAWLTDPVSGLIDGDPGPDQEPSIKSGNRTPPMGRLRPTMIVVMRISLPRHFGAWFLPLRTSVWGRRPRLMETGSMGRETANFRALDFPIALRIGALHNFCLRIA
ncbi:hypothetical protein CFBP7129_29550 (plasmid) [Agrobacterium tumefaciens]|uniref:Uncharacterized protein n=1 Tax=Agrobacterium tumefaciens TaxID=358 RepID=A0A4D7YT27_AGRTU|nr:hypothetical protein CFBP7129_29550 [Agrobacterium tumefaciens]